MVPRAFTAHEHCAVQQSAAAVPSGPRPPCTMLNTLLNTMLITVLNAMLNTVLDTFQNHAQHHA